MKLTKHLFRCAVVCAIAFAPASHASQDDTGPVLDAVYPLEITASGVFGTGGDWLNEQAGNAQLLGLGEQHATADIAELTQAWYVQLHTAGYNSAMVEVGPWSMLRAQSLMRRSKADFISDAVHRADGLAYPFLFFNEFTDFVMDVIEHQDTDRSVVFGLGQEFIASGTIHADYLAALATTPDQNDAVEVFRANLAENPWLVGSSPPDVFDQLAGAFQSGPQRARPDR